MTIVRGGLRRELRGEHTRIRVRGGSRAEATVGTVLKEKDPDEGTSGQALSPGCFMIISSGEHRSNSLTARECPIRDLRRVNPREDF